MKRTIISILLFISFFIFFDFKEVETEEYKEINTNETSYYEEDDFVIKVSNQNIKKIIQLLNKYDINLLKIKPDQNRFNINLVYGDDEQEIIKNYTKNIPEEDKLYVKNNGFLVNKLYVRTMNINIINLEKEINIKLVA